MKTEVQEIDVEGLMEQILERIGRNRGGGDASAAATPALPLDDSYAVADFTYLHSAYDIQNVALSSHRRMIGPLVVALKNALRKLLTPILQRQVAYNAACARVTARLGDTISAQDTRQAQAMEAAHGRMDAIERDSAQRHGEASDALARVRADIHALESQLRQEALASELRLREALATHSEEARAARTHVQQEMVAEHLRLQQEMLAVRSQIRQEMLGVHTQLREEVTAQAHTLGRVTQSSAAAREKISRAERKLRRILHGLDTAQIPRRLADLDREAPRSIEDEESEFDYAGFEERFRGSEEDIKERQRPYVQYFEGSQNVLDLGCGRGEFLDLLAELGLRARGLDIDLDMVLLCREKGLDVVQDNAFAYLEALPDGSADGIFAAQVIEHLRPRRVIELVKLCHRKLAPGAALVLETPNPKCLMVFAESFYMDPSHIQPLHPDTMQFLFETTGFQRVELRFSAPVDPSLRIPPLRASDEAMERFNQSMERLNSLLFGYQDYAVIGRKGHSA